MVSVPELPPNTSLQYLAEGAANVVYRLVLSPSSPSIAADIIVAEDDDHSGSPTSPTSEIEALPYDPIFSGKLVRLRKALSSTVSNEKSFKHFQEVIRPLFPAENLVGQALVRLTPSLMNDCNRQLRLDEESGSRPWRRCGLYLALDEPYGTLVTDMSPRGDAGEVVVEFKPKWLAQSPSAPPGSKRCRTCALRAKRNARGTDATEDRNASLCPLDLVSRDRAKVERAVAALCFSSKDTQSHQYLLRGRLVDFLYTNPLLHRLKQLQLELDRFGILKIEVTSRDFLTAMTLRDCTMFVKIPLDRNGAIEARLGDLDLKSSGMTKAAYWSNIEKGLIEEGWYTATERVSSPVKCGLDSNTTSRPSSN